MQSMRTTPDWLNLNLGELGGSMVNTPSREDIEIPLNEQLIVEYYSR